MVRIRVIYSEEPKFGPEDQHPECERYRVAGWIVDAIGGEPTEKQVLDVLVGKPQADEFAAPPIDPSP